jgi:hypothetical protein
VVLIVQSARHHLLNHLIAVLVVPVSTGLVVPVVDRSDGMPPLTSIDCLLVVVLGLEHQRHLVVSLLGNYGYWLLG